MKNFKANNYQQAKRELEAFSPDLANQLKENISNENAGAYNVIFCSSQHIPTLRTYKNTFFVQTFNFKGYEKAKKFAAINYDKMILLHDPNKVAETPKPEPKLEVKKENK
jgi:hypothetical protein